MSYTVTVDFSDVRRLLSGLRQNLRDARARWLAMAPVYYQHLSQNFRQEGVPDKWAPLKPSTLRRRRQGRNRSNPQARILRDTGLLYRAVSSPGGPHSILSISEKSMTIGTSLRYARFHQSGTRHMPARPPYTITEDVLRRMSAAGLRQILRNARKP